MFRIYTVITGIVIAVLLLFVVVASHFVGWSQALAMTAKSTIIMIEVVCILGLIGLAIYALGLLGMGAITGFFVVVIVLLEQMKEFVAGLFRRNRGGPPL